MVVENCCGWGKTREKDITGQLAEWIAGSQTEELCMECVEALLENYPAATGTSVKQVEDRA